jgi:hypothetical protein
VNGLVADESELKVNRNLFAEKETGDLTIQVSSDLDSFQALTGAVAFGVTSADDYTSPTPKPVTAADRDPAAQRAALEQHLKDRGSPDDVVTKALATYDSMSPTIVPSPKLRAALAALTGTFAEPAIAADLTANNCLKTPDTSIDFKDPEADGLFAQVVHNSAGTTREIRLLPALEGDRIEHLMPVLAHESIHCDTQDGVYEEVAATAFETMLYLQLAVVFPDIVHDHTDLTVEENVSAVSMVNSGAAHPESIGILPSPGVKQAFPNAGTPYASFADRIAVSYSALGPTSPDEPLAVQYVQTLAQIAGVQAQSPFNIPYLDALFGVVENESLMTGAITAFGLAPITN